MRVLTVRPAAGTLPRRSSVIVPLLLAVGLLAVPAFALSARADHVRPARVPDPAAVVAAYAAALNAGDLGRVLAFYADGAVHAALPAVEGSGVCLGKAQFRMYYEQAVAHRDRIEVVAGSLAVDGDRVTFAARLASDPWRALGLEHLEAEVEAVVEGGRFVSHIAVLTPGSMRELLTAQGAILTALTGGAPQDEERPFGPR